MIVKLSACLLAFLLVALCNVEGKSADPDHFKEGGKHDANYDHEAFLGKDEAGEFDELTPEQSKTRLAKLVPKIDKDGDGEITEEELKNHIRFMQERYVTNDVLRTWKQYEFDDLKDGKLLWTAYRERVYGPADGEVEPEYAKMIDRDEKRWKEADADSDGLISQKEYECFMHPEDCEHMKNTVVMETTLDIDKDGDGFVTMAEYISDMYRPDDYPDLPKGQEPDWVASEREMFKEHRDKDGDGKLDFDEMKAWITPDGFDHAEAEAHHLIHMADDDKDNKLSLDEILAHHDIFVGSQATDYGEQLQKHDPSEL